MALAFPPTPTPGQQYTGPNGVVYEWDNALGAWVKVNSVQAATAGTTAATGAARIPSGPAAARPTSPANGFFRFNEDTDKLEVWNGLIWAEVASSNPVVDTFVPQTTPITGTASAVIPAGNTANRQTNPLPLGGYTRFNTDTTLMEVFDGTIWTPVGAPPNAGLGLNLSGITPNQILKLSVPQQSTPPTPGTLAPEAISGSLYWDDVLSTLFIRYDNGGTPAWVQAAPAAGSIGVTSINASGGTTGLSFSGGPVTTAGTLTLAGTLGIANGGTGATTGAGALAGLGLSVNASGGTTGLTFSGGPVTSSGTLTLGGTLAVANGGTGASTQAGAINNLLPGQGGNSGKYLTTDGSNVSWASTSGAPGSVVAWVSFNGAGGGIRSSYNVSSVTVSTPGIYLVNFATALADANYAAVITAGGTNNADAGGSQSFTTQTTTQVSVLTYDSSSGGLLTCLIVNVIVCR